MTALYVDATSPRTVCCSKLRSSDLLLIIVMIVL